MSTTDKFKITMPNFRELETDVRIVDQEYLTKYNIRSPNLGKLQIDQADLSLAIYNQYQLKQKLGSQFKDGDIMMEGPYDHYEGGSPSERFMATIILPHKLGIMARFTSLGYRLTYGIAEDSLAGGLGIKLIGQDIKRAQARIDEIMQKRFDELNFIQIWKLFWGFVKEQGSALLHLIYEGEIAADIGPSEPDKMPQFNYLSTPAPKDKKIVKIEAFNRQQFTVAEDDGKGNPTLFDITYYMGKRWGRPKVRIHRSRVIWAVDQNVDRDFEGHCILKTCYNELVIASMCLKGTGEIVFRWSTGHPVFFTTGLNPSQVQNFKSLLGNPIRDEWHVFPKELVDRVEMLSQKTGAIDIPHMADLPINFIVAASGIPRPILMGEVAGVVKGGEVNERSYFSTLTKEDMKQEPFVFEFFNKDIILREAISDYQFEYDWGIRQTMSEMDKIDIETKTLANFVTKLQYLPFNAVLEESGYNKLENMVEPEFKEYARKLGNSVLSKTIFDIEAQEQQIELQKQSQQQKLMSGKTVLGNDGKGKGENRDWSEKRTKQPQTPDTFQKASGKAISMVKNKVAASFAELHDAFSIPELEKALGLNKTTIYKIIGWKEE